jgi:HAD superfamily hydrolase (TIGR01509 family)
MPDLQALIFDIDGTMALTELTGHRVAFNRAFAQFGIPEEWSEEDYARWRHTPGGRDKIRKVLELHGRDTGLVEEIYAAKAEHYGNLGREGAFSLRPGVLRLIREAQSEGIPVAVATTSSAESVSGILPALFGDDWRKEFVSVVNGSQVERIKPDPEVYVQAVRELGIPAEGCIAIEDASIGVISAKEAGVRCVATVHEFTQGDDFSEADLVVDSLGEPGDPPIQVFSDPWMLGDFHHVDLALLQTLVASLSPGG